LPFAQTYANLARTDYLGENARNEIIWSYLVYRHETKLIKSYRPVATIDGRVVGHDTLAGTLYCSLPGDKHLVSVDDQTL